MKNSKKYLYVGVITLLIVIGVSLAYFGITIIGNDTVKGNKVVTGNLELTYTDTTEISLENAFPGDSFTKTISVKNTGTKDVSYNLVWTELNNEITNNELVIEATCKRLNSNGAEEGTCESISQTPVSSNTVKKNISIEPNITHEYTVKVTFIDTGKLQDYNKNKTFTGALGIKEYKNISPEPTYCTYDGELTQGTEYVNGQYTYRYMQENSMKENSDDIIWQNIESEGWGVTLTDKTSTDPVTSTLCTYINNKPVVSMSLMFMESQATSIDLSSFDTKNVINMLGMFAVAKAAELNVSNFDTSNVTNMLGMFQVSEAKNINGLTNFDTSNVTNMAGMFVQTSALSLDLTSFNTSKVTSMEMMFAVSQATEIKGLNKFDTSNVTDMYMMFHGSQAKELDVSNFDTSKVTNMAHMFNSTQVTSLDVSNFNTSNVTTMGYMFNGFKGTTLDVSNFNTSKVIGMAQMFSFSQLETLDISNFDTSNVIGMYGMFEETKFTTLDLSNFDTSNVTSMSYMFRNSTSLKTIYVSNKFITDKVTSGSGMFTDSTNLVGGAGTTYNSSYTDKTYARIDGGTSSPGYFTAK